MRVEGRQGLYCIFDLGALGKEPSIYRCQMHYHITVMALGENTCNLIFPVKEMLFEFIPEPILGGELPYLYYGWRFINLTWLTCLNSAFRSESTRLVTGKDKERAKSSSKAI